MKYIKIFLIICFFSTHVFSNENEIKYPVRYIDINLIVNDSLVGKKIKKLLLMNLINLLINIKNKKMNLEIKKMKYYQKRMF